MLKMEAEVRIELTQSRFAGGHNFQSVIQPSGESTESRTQNLGFVDLHFIQLEYRLKNLKIIGRRCRI